jgi:hypothetical protein
MKKLSFVAIALSACTHQGETQDNRICRSVPSVVIAGNWGDCLHYNAYRLARAPGSNREIADAVVTACGDSIAWRYNHTKAEERNQLLDEINSSAPKFAILYVIEARAGHCEPGSPIVQ